MKNKTAVRLLKDFVDRLYEDQDAIKENPHDNHPLKEKMKEWQVYSDIASIVYKKGDVLKIADLVEEHDMDFEYYLRDLQLLVTDGLIEWYEEND